MLTLLVTLLASLGGAQMLGDVSTSSNDYNYNEDAAGRIAVVARSDADFKNARILLRHRRSGGWSAFGPISFTDPRYSDSDPWLTPDGKTLYFISNRPVSGVEPKADTDIWRAHRTRDGWSQPEHLADVSSPAPELGPEFHQGVLTFSSVRRGAPGKLDIFAAKAIGRGFDASEPLAGPFNSAESESDFTISPDGRTALFWRSEGETAQLMLSHRGAEGWSEPLRLKGESLSPGRFNFTPHFSADGRSVWFASTAVRPGQDQGLADIYLATVPSLPR